MTALTDHGRRRCAGRRGARPPVLFLAATLACVPALALLLSSAPVGAADAFARGQARASVIAGSGRAFDEDYLVIGAGLAYYPVDGLELGVDGEAWTGGDPSVYKLSPQLRYVFGRGSIRPYAGAFYRYTDIEGQDGLQSFGGRAGFYLSLGGGTYLGLGLVQERYLDCDEDVYRSCEEGYAEAVLSVGLR